MIGRKPPIELGGGGKRCCLPTLTTLIPTGLSGKASYPQCFVVLLKGSLNTDNYRVK